MKNKTIIIAILALLAGMSEAAGQAVARLSEDTIALGDQTTLSVSRALNYPSTDMLTANDIVALSQEFDTATHTQTTVLTCFEPGEHYVKLGPDDSLLLVVNDVDVDTATAELRDIAPLQKVPYTFWEIFRWILLGIVVVAVVLLARWLITNRKRIGTLLGPAPVVDNRNPWERANDGLEDLRNRHVWQAGKVKEYHTELTDIVRRFIEEAMVIHATEMTSDETIDALDKAGFGTETAMLRDIFTTADLVKFAKSEPLPHEHDRSMADAFAFVAAVWQKVKPDEKPTPDEEQTEKEAQHE